MFDSWPEKAIIHYNIGMKRGHLSLPEDFNGVLLWSLIDNRPFLRCMHGYGLCLWKLKRFKEAEKVFERILWLNPPGNGQKSQNTTSGSPKKGPLEVTKRNSNDTYINETNLNNVNRAGSKGDVENSREEIIEIAEENEGGINDIRRKIKESLKEGEKYSFIESKNSGIEKKLLEKNTNLKGKYPKNDEVKEYPKSKRDRFEEKEQLAKEIAEELDDDHSLGAFRAVVDKISEQQIRIFLSIIKDTRLTGKIKKNKGAMFISLAKEYAKKNNIDLNFK